MKGDSAAGSAPAPVPAVPCSAPTRVDEPGAPGRPKDPAKRPSLLTAAEAADFLHMTRDGFYAWRLRHGVKSVIPGRALRFRVDDLVLAESVSPARDTVLDFAELGRQHARRGFRA